MKKSFRTGPLFCGKIVGPVVLCVTKIFFLRKQEVQLQSMFGVLAAVLEEIANHLSFAIE